MSLASRDYDEKRNFIRMTVNAPIDVILSHGATVRGMCYNLSGGGMLISTTEAPPLGSQVEVTIQSSHGHSPTLKALAAVTRIQTRQVSEGNTNDLGLRILKILG